MSVVVAFDEWLYTATLYSVLLVVFSVYWLWISLNTGNNCVSVAFVRITIIVVLQNDSLPTCISAGQYDDHLSWFHNFAHSD